MLPNNHSLCVCVCVYIIIIIFYLFYFHWIRAQTIMKARLKGAQTGRSLLKKKADALSMRFRQILRKIIEV